MSNYRRRLTEARRELEKQVRSALRDRRRLFYIGVLNPVFTAIAAVLAYRLAGPEVSLYTMGIGALKDGSIWAGIHSEIRQYLQDKRVLSAEVGKIKVFCGFVEEGDDEMYGQAKTMIMAFFEELKGEAP